MTKERRLAVQMWREIAKSIRSGDIVDFGDLNDYKERFCDRFDLEWNSDCWLCQYVPSCGKCPLCKHSGCPCNTDGNPYAYLDPRDDDMERIPYTKHENMYASYADEITNVLEGK